MSREFSRRSFLSALAAGLAAPALADAPLTSIRPQPRPGGPGTVPEPEALIEAARLGGAVGYVVADAASGEVLEARSPLLTLPPASVAKAATAAYALNTLGPDYRFTTRLLGTGPLVDGRLDGHLVLEGAGDPTLDTDALFDLAAALKEAGVREITGSFLAYGGALPYVRAIDPLQPEHLGYNPSVSGLNLNYNRVHFEWTPSGGDYTVTMDGRSGRASPEVSMATMRIVDRDAPVYTYADAGDADAWTVARGALGNGGSRWLPVRRPELYAAEVFQVLARAHGIVLPDPSVARFLPGGHVLASHDSAPLDEIVRGMLRYSTNITAEALGLAASRARGVGARTLAQSAGAMSDWAEAALGTRRAAFVDHSGLGDRTRISARDMVAMLTHPAMEVVAPLLRDIAPRDNGYNVIIDPAYSIAAKTGSLNFVSALGGYVQPGQGEAQGRRLAFAIFTGDVERRASLSRAEMERPYGGRSWQSRSRILQQRLIARWVDLYGEVQPGTLLTKG